MVYVVSCVEVSSVHCVEVSSVHCVEVSSVHCVEVSSVHCVEVSSVHCVCFLLQILVTRNDVAPDSLPCPDSKLIYFKHVGRAYSKLANIIDIFELILLICLIQNLLM